MVVHVRQRLPVNAKVMSLFGNLPAPGLESSRPEDDLDELESQEEEEASGKDGDGEGNQQRENSPPPAKRPRIEQSEHAKAAAPSDDSIPIDTLVGPNDQLGQALAKITSHISKPTKFAKASALLRQLLDTGTIDKDHRHQLFLAIKAAFSDPCQAIEPTLRKEYRRLMTAVNEHAQVLSKAERAQLAVYSTWALTQNELFTDDSFMFNKVVAKLKSSISELQPADEELEAAARRLSGEEPLSPEPSGQSILPLKTKPAGASDPFGLDSLFQEQQQPSTSSAAAAAGEDKKVGDESDPFGLDSFLQTEQQQKEQQDDNPPAASAAATAAAAAKQKSLAWSPAEQQVMLRQALLDCLSTAKTQHQLAWAQTSVELLMEHAFQQKDRFCSNQRQQLLELMNFVKAARVARRTGRGAGAAKGSEMTAFERARAEWGSAAISVRKGLGSGGDAKSNNWLG